MATAHKRLECGTPETGPCESYLDGLSLSEFEEICERANAAGFDVGATLRDTISNAARHIRKELDAIDQTAATRSVEAIVADSVEIDRVKAADEAFSQRAFIDDFFEQFPSPTLRNR